jgi:hypothetical protein
VNLSAIENNPWAARLSHLLDMQEIKQRATYIPEPLQGDGKWLPTDTARLQKKLEELFLCSDLSAQILHTMVVASITHYLEYFPSASEVVKRLYGENHSAGGGSLGLTPVYCLTGLAGTGKSALMTAFTRIFPLPESIDLGQHKGFQMKGIERITFNSQSRLTSVLQTLKHPNDSNHRNTKLIQSVVSNSVRNGIALILVDETQFQTSSSTAITLTSSTLEGIAQLKTPFIFACNYSLAQKLMTTNHEMRDRLLSRPMLIFPDDAGSDDWINYIDHCRKICGAWLQISQEDYFRVYCYTYGIKRYVVALLCYAFDRMLSNRKNAVTINDLQAAYQQAEFQSTRAVVEDLFQIDSLGGASRRRHHKSILCPFVVDSDLREKKMKVAEARAQGKVNSKILEMSAKQDERMATKSEAPSTKSSPVKETKRPRRKTTQQELLEKSIAYADQKGH